MGSGGPGTVFLKSALDEYGELYLNNEGNLPAKTEIPALDAIDNDGKSVLPVTPAPTNRKDPRVGRLLSGRVPG